MRGRRTSSLAGSPLLVGAATTVVTIAAVFLSYNANTGLPFVPTYDLTARLPDAAGLVKGNEVRIGGKRVGIIKVVEARPGPGGRPVARLRLQLEQKVEPLRSDTRITARPRSPLGLKYLELVPGRRGRPIPSGGAIPLAGATPTVELDEVLNVFDVEARRAARGTVDELGTGLAGRGVAVNELLVEAPPLFDFGERVARNLSDPRTDLRALLRGLDRSLAELAPVRGRLGSLVAAADVTAAALERSRVELGETIVEAPPTEQAATRALRALRPVLIDAELLVREIRPGVRALPSAAARLHLAIRTGVPVLRRVPLLSARLRGLLRTVDALARDPVTLRALRRLRATLVSAEPILRFAAPFQTRCNYLGLYTRNANSVISEGDNSGTWFRTLVLRNPEESQPRAEPAPELHANPYPRTAAPGQGGECEAGNEVYAPGQRIGPIPGVQGGTETTRPPPGVPQP